MCHKKIKRPANLSIEEGTLSAALFRVKQRCGKVDDFLHFLSFAKEHGLWIPIDSVFDLGTPGRSSLTHFSIDALDDFMGRSPLTQVDYLTVFKPRFSFTASKARRHYVHVMHKITP